jgi:hypothetical protein
MMSHYAHRLSSVSIAIVTFPGHALLVASVFAVSVVIVAVCVVRCCLERSEANL